MVEEEDATYEAEAKRSRGDMTRQKKQYDGMKQGLKDSFDKVKAAHGKAKAAYDASVTDDKVDGDAGLKAKAEKLETRLGEVEEQKTDFETKLGEVIAGLKKLDASDKQRKTDKATAD